MESYTLRQWINYAERYFYDISLESNLLSPQSTNLLMGFCLEILLKALLINKGEISTPEQLLLYRHNINRMYEESLILYPSSPLSESTKYFEFKKLAKDLHEVLERGSDRYPKKNKNLQFGLNMWDSKLKDLIEWEKENLNLNLEIINLLS
jgi:hypothetical protein